MFFYTLLLTIIFSFFYPLSLHEKLKTTKENFKTSTIASQIIHMELTKIDTYLDNLSLDLFLIDFDIELFIDSF
jgi:hypothetical protein